MTLAAFELNDGGLRLITTEGREHHAPAFALHREQQLLVGWEAARWARKEPSNLINEHFFRLSSDALPRPLPQARTYADLVHTQLESLWAAGKNPTKEVVLAVPSLWSREQLALLLGIAEACRFDAIALIDSSLATLAGAAPREQGLHIVIDGELHQGALLLFSQYERKLTRSRVSALPSAALSDLDDLWLRAIAEQFIAETRFDPLHSGATEQALYNELPVLLKALANGDTPEASILLKDQKFTVALELNSLISRVTPRYQVLLETLKPGSLPEGTLWLHERLNRFPGLGEYLSNGLNREVKNLEGKCLNQAIHTHAQSLQGTGGALTYRTELPALPKTSTRFSAPSHDQIEHNAPKIGGNPTPTHLLIGWMAVPLPQDENLLPVGGEAGATSQLKLPPLGRLDKTQGIWNFTPTVDAYLNGLLVNGPIKLTVGVSIEVGNSRLSISLIRVVSE